MKKLIYSLCLSMALFACQSGDTSTEAPETPEVPNPATPDFPEVPNYPVNNEPWMETNLTRSEQEMAKQENVFAFNLFKQISKEEKGNLFISPMSASMAIAMTANGANGNTLNEMKATLGFENYSLEEMNVFHKKIRRHVIQLKETTSDLANSIWINENFPVLNAFKTNNQNYFNAEVQNLDFSDPTSKDVINKWCEDKTAGRIKELLKEIKADHTVFLINTLFLQAYWETPFFEEANTAGYFTNLNGSKSAVTFMNQQQYANYLKNEEIHLVALPYSHRNGLNMYVLLPQGNNTVDKIANSLNSTKWNEWLNGMKNNRPTYISLPKFRVEYERELQEALIAMGMKDAFDKKTADFSNLSSISTCISKVKQKTFVQIDEKGTEAAAGTIVEMIATSTGEEPPTPELFKVDRPFIYIIQEKVTGTIVFMGVMKQM
ncbi:serpin family protein [Bacteroides sp. 224]|uniref:serpin family protein n=1 Tax=Bacteroides sp. 224 TaxID=2302936 RepID=UPI0013D64CB2|nr:serpin family protein [Bacteroides sp. 224]